MALAGLGVAAVGSWLLLLPGAPPEPGAVEPPEPIAPTAEPGPAVRVVDGERSVALQVASRELRRADGASVVLAGVVHVGTADFYAGLLRRLERCELVLVEGLDAGADAVAPAEHGWSALARALEVVFQADVVAFPASRERSGAEWVHSDLTVAVVRGMLVARGADPTWIERVLSPVLPEDLAPFLEGMERADPRTRAHTRLAVVDALGNARAGLVGPGADHYRAVILDARNEALVADLVPRLGGPGPVCVLYGAAHQPGLEALLGTHGFGRTSERWDDVMEVTLESLGIGPVQLAQFRRAYGRR